MEYLIAGRTVSWCIGVCPSKIRETGVTPTGVGRIA
jgi:hypothetical protein